MDISLGAKLNQYLAKFSFNASTRLDFYRATLLFLENQVRLNEALKELYFIYSEGNKKPTAAIAIIIENCLQGMNSGVTFTEQLAKWIPTDEGMLLCSGESSGNIMNSLREAEKIILAKKEITSAVAGATVYPIILMGMTGFLLSIVSYQLVPKLATMVKPELWTGSALMLHYISRWITGYGLLTIGIIIFFMITIFLTLGRFRGFLRVLLDAIPPWSIYRMVQGAIFLLNISSLVQSGMLLNVALKQLATSASPWLEERINGALFELNLGKNFGEALSDSGYNFPDKKANRFISVISNYSGLDIALKNFGNKWLEDSIKNIRKAANIIFASGMVIIAGTMILVITGVNELQNIIQNSFGQ